MEKKELKKIITEVFDNGMFGKEDPTIVHLGAREDIMLYVGVNFSYNGNGQSYVKSVDLDFGTGYVHLETEKYSRDDMINIFTSFVWCVFIDYED